MEKLINYAKELKGEFETQETDGQAHPRFWVIMDFREEITIEGHDDTVKLLDLDTCNSLTEDEYKESVKERIAEGEFDAHKTEDILWAMEHGTIHSLIGEAEDEDNFHIIYTMEIPYIVPNTFFLTKKDAKEYLEQYGYHHSSKAHTYAMTALRSPSFEKLINLILGVK